MFTIYFCRQKLVPVIAFLSLVLSLNFAFASTAALQQATATFSQNFFGNFSVDKAINGTTADDLGWAIAPDAGTSIPAQTAVFETVNNVGFAGGSLITFTLNQTHSNPGHTLGRFRLSITTDDRSLFADGLANGGDVTANWTVLDSSYFVSANGTILTKLGDFSILASGTAPATDIYSFTATTFLTGITGVRFEALEDPSLPFSGPGRWPGNGNFVLSEFQMDVSVVPEPSASDIFVLGSLFGLFGRKLRLPSHS